MPFLISSQNSLVRLAYPLDSMNNHQPRRRRKSPRLKEYDYSLCAGYFITICTSERSNILGEVKSGKLRLLPPGKITEKWLLKIPEKFETAKIGEYAIMPDHLHAIIFLVGGDPRVAPDNNKNQLVPNPCVTPDHNRDQIISIPRIIQWFKTMSTNEYIKWKKENAIEARKKPLWQRSFYDHIIRNEHDQNSISKYISENPLKFDDRWDKFEK